MAGALGWQGHTWAHSVLQSQARKTLGHVEQVLRRPAAAAAAAAAAAQAQKQRRADTVSRSGHYMRLHAEEGLRAPLGGAGALPAEAAAQAVRALLL